MINDPRARQMARGTLSALAMVIRVRKREGPTRSRGVLLSRIEETLRKDNPRLLMTGIVAATAGTGLIASAVMYHAGIRSMALRYGLSVAFAYAAFMFFAWLWILRKRRERHVDPGAEDEIEVGEYGDDDLPTGTDDGSDQDTGVLSARFGSRASSDLNPAEGLRSALDVDDAIVTVAVGAAIAAAVAASFYVVMIAPQLLAELLLDGVFATIFWRRLRAVDRRHWLDSAFSRTWIPALGTAFFFIVAGVICQWYAPEASSLGGVLAHMRDK